MEGGRSPPRLYILHIIEESKDFNSWLLRGWGHGNTILRFAARLKCKFWLAWRFLMQTRFDELSAEALYAEAVVELE